jgi:hypothetical protein
VTSFSAKKIRANSGRNAYYTSTDSDMYSTTSEHRQYAAARWVSALNGGAIGLTSSSLFMLLGRLVLVGEPYRGVDSLLVAAACFGFVTHLVLTDIFRLGKKNLADQEKITRKN